MDIDPSVNPDLLLDLKDLDKHFEPNSVDFIMAGHVFEHFSYMDSLSVMAKCFSILKPLHNLVLVVPDYTKCTDLKIEDAERIILAGGQHKILCDSVRIKNMLKSVGFQCTIEITDLKQVPFIIVPDIHNPNPESWQTAFVAFKLP